jgi:pyruvate/2-oxoglutarate dehydrogenase complex dihydrolipoamide dehydrogenase (E3) component
VTGYKKELLNLIKFQKRQVERYGVECHLNHVVTAEFVKAEDPDLVILATGSFPSSPPVEGIGKSNVVTFFDEVLKGELPLQKKTVVIGGGPIGCEVALHLSEHGCPVTVVEMLQEIGTRLETMTRKILVKKLNENNVRIMVGFKLSKVEDNGIVAVGEDGEKLFLEAERIVITVGNRPDNRLFDEIKSLGYKIHRIGDCLEPRSAKAAIYEGEVLGLSI